MNLNETHRGYPAVLAQIVSVIDIAVTAVGQGLSGISYITTVVVRLV